MEFREPSSRITPANEAKYTGSKVEMGPVTNFTSGLSALVRDHTSMPPGLLNSYRNNPNGMVNHDRHMRRPSGVGDGQIPVGKPSSTHSVASGYLDSLGSEIKAFDQSRPATRLRKPSVKTKPYKGTVSPNPTGVKKGQEIVDGWASSAQPALKPSNPGPGTGSSVPMIYPSDSCRSLDSSEFGIVEEGDFSSELTHPFGRGAVTLRPIVDWADPDRSPANSSRPKTAPGQRPTGLGSTMARPSSASGRLETAKDESTDGASISRQNSETGAALIFPETRLHSRSNSTLPGLKYPPQPYFGEQESPSSSSGTNSPIGFEIASGLSTPIELARPPIGSYPPLQNLDWAALLNKLDAVQSIQMTIEGTDLLHQHTLEATAIIANATARLSAQTEPTFILPETWRKEGISARQILLTTVKDTITKVRDHSQTESVFTPKQLNHLKCILNFEKSLARYENGKGSDVAFLALMRSTLGHLDQILDTKVPGGLTVSTQDLAATESNTVFEALQQPSETPYSNLAIRSDTRHKAAIYTILYGGEHKPVEPKGVIHTEIEGDMNGGSYESSVASSGTSTPALGHSLIPFGERQVSQVERSPLPPLNSGISGDQFREIFDVYYSCSTFKPDFETHILSSHFDVISDAVDAVVEIHQSTGDGGVAPQDSFFATPIETTRPILAPPTTIREWVGQVNEHLMKGTDPQDPPIQLPEDDTEWQTASDVMTFRDNQVQQQHDERRMLQNLFHSQLRFEEQEDDA